MAQINWKIDLSVILSLITCLIMVGVLYGAVDTRLARVEQDQTELTKAVRDLTRVVIRLETLLEDRQERLK